MKLKIEVKLESLRREEEKTDDPRIAYACDRAIRELREVLTFIDELMPIKAHTMGMLHSDVGELE